MPWNTKWDQLGQMNREGPDETAICFDKRNGRDDDTKGAGRALSRHTKGREDEGKVGCVRSRVETERSGRTHVK